MLTKKDIIAPHGGALVDRTVPVEEHQERLREAAELPSVSLDPLYHLGLADDLHGGLQPLGGLYAKGGLRKRRRRHAPQ